jgi:hypothetical protein
MNDSVYCSLRHSILLRQRCARFARKYPLADIYYILLQKLARAHIMPSDVWRIYPSFPKRVPCIVTRSPKEQMPRVDTSPIITRVTNKHACRDIPYKPDIRKPVCVPFLAVDCHRPIPRRMLGASPLPALVPIRRGYLVDKPFLGAAIPSHGSLSMRQLLWASPVPIATVQPEHNIDVPTGRHYPGAGGANPSGPAPCTSR